MKLRSTYAQVAGNIDVVDPYVLGSLNGDGITIVGENLGNLDVPNNDVGLLVDGQADTRDVNLLEPDAPMMDLLEVTDTLAAPEMAPFTTMTAAPSALAAAEKAARLETVVVVPPAPPLVLLKD